MRRGTRSKTTAPTKPARKSESDEIVVFSILRDSTCAECGEELGKGNFLHLEDERPLCLRCSDLDHLVYLPAGDAALTRRSSRHSTLRAVVLRFSRARKRYERQGILVEEEALERAEQECLADEEARRLAQIRAAEKRAQLDEQYVTAFAEWVGRLFPGCPAAKRRVIAEHACLKHSGRIGRSAAAKQFQEDAIELAVRAHVRHRHTSYDTLLQQGVPRLLARRQVRAETDQILDNWRHPKP